MTRPGFEANLRLLFPNLEERPHHDTLARLLARIDVLEIEPAHLDMIRLLMRRKKFRRYLIGGGYPIAIDGTQKFTRAQCWDAACLERKVGNKKTSDPQPSRPPSWPKNSSRPAANSGKLHAGCSVSATAPAKHNEPFTGEQYGVDENAWTKRASRHPDHSSPGRLSAGHRGQRRLVLRQFQARPRRRK
jgi:hypothetical protein